MEEKLRSLIRQFGPIDIGRFMQEVNTHYYATRDPLGMDGDFTTAPEISQLFGEMIGLCLADAWLKSGSPHAHLVEFGPGRGTLMADLLRATKHVPDFHARLSIHLVENSPSLRDKQKQKLASYPHVIWHDDASTLPDDQPLLIVANEFFDALPIRQAVMTPSGWQERVIGLDNNRLIFGTSVMPPALLPQRPAEIGTMIEFSPVRDTVFGALCARLTAQGGAMLIIDYGHDTPHASGDTLQAVYKHHFCDVLEHVGDADLTSHIDFAHFKTLAAASGCVIQGSVPQGTFLKSLGIETRLAQLMQKNPNNYLSQGVTRLTDPKQMGDLFRVLGIIGDQFSPLSGL